MALEARRRRRRRTTKAKSAPRRRRRSPMSLAAPRRVRRRRRSGLSELGAMKTYQGILFQFLEAGAGAVAGAIVSKQLKDTLKIENPYLTAAAGAGISFVVAQQLRRPIFASGMAANFAKDFIKSFNFSALNENMDQGDFVSMSELSQPQMVYLSPSGEPVFMQEDGSMLYADGNDSGMSLADYEYV